MTANTGLLTARCDPYGAESRIQLLGGVYPEAWAGRIMWHCQNRAAARYRMVCTGGAYGQRTAPDGGTVPAYECPGGHAGQVMPLCTDHRREIQKRQSDLCPRCAYPPAARGMQERADALQLQMQAARGDWPQLAALQAGLDQVTARFAELMELGIVHKCPLRLIEVS